MDLVLFANGVWDVLVPIGVVVFWIVASIFRGINETKATAPKRAPAPPEKRPDPRKELERFLDELGAGKPAQKPALPPEKPIKIELPKPAVTSTPRAPKAPRPGKERRAPSEPKVSVRDRHLHSRLEHRKSEEMHSRLETSHIESSLSTAFPGLSAPAEVPLATKKAAAIPTSQISTNVPLSQQELARAFVLSTVFGPPRALQEFETPS